MGQSGAFAAYPEIIDNLTENAEFSWFYKTGPRDYSLYWYYENAGNGHRLEEKVANRANDDHPIEVLADCSEIPDNDTDPCANPPVLHFRQKTEIVGGLEEYATYWRDADLDSANDIQLPLNQWEPAPLVIGFWAKASEDDAALRVNLIDMVPALENGTVAHWLSPEITLGTLWAYYEIDTGDHLTHDVALRKLSFRLGLVQGSATEDVEAWVDGIKVMDGLDPDYVDYTGCANSGSPVEVEIDEDGIVNFDGDPFLPHALWFNDYPLDADLRLDWIELDARMKTLKERGFNTIWPERYHLSNAYNSKRELWRIMRYADCNGLFAIPVIPGYDIHNHWPVIEAQAKEWMSAFNGHPSLVGWITGDELSITDYGPPDGVGRIDNQRVLKWARNAEMLENGGAGFYRPIIAITYGPPLEVGHSNPWHGWTSPWLLFRRLAPAVDIISPNHFIKRANECSGAEMQIARATDICRKSQILCEGDDAKCPGLLLEPNPGDCEDQEVEGYCWSPKAVWPLIQLGPNKQDTRPVWAGELEMQGMQALLHGASGIIYGRSAGGLAAGPGGAGSECHRNCENWQSKPECDGVLPGQYTICPGWQLLVEEYRDCWEVLESGVGGTPTFMHELWDMLPTVFDRMDGLFEDIVLGLPAEGTTREWLVPEGDLDDIVTTYVHKQRDGHSHENREHMLFGDNILAGLADNEVASHPRERYLRAHLPRSPGQLRSTIGARQRDDRGGADPGRGA